MTTQHSGGLVLKRSTLLRYGAVLLTLCAISIAAAYRASTLASQAAWYSVLPPLLAVALALATHRLLPSLALGVIAGGLLAHAPAGAWGRGLLAGSGYVLGAASDATNLQILIFVALVLMMITVLVVAGGLQGVVNRLARFARGSRSTQFATVLMGLVIFIDDYANTMIVGSSMRPLTDRYRVSREKLAFLVDATSAPIAGIAVISTWIGYEVGLFSETSQSLGLGRDGYAMFFDALSYRFYCILMIVFVLANVLTGRDFGPMARAQQRARRTGAVAAPNARPMTPKAYAAAEPDAGVRPRARVAVLPIGGLFLFLLAALWVDGGGSGYGVLAPFNPRIWRDVLAASENSILILVLASALSVGLACATAHGWARLPVRRLGRALTAGLRASLLPITILILAWSLKGACDGLQTGQFLVDAVGDTVAPLYFPALVFALAGMVAFATGTSWGTMAILIPTAVPVAFQLDGALYGLTTMMTLGAVLDGAILGDHCSPISDTTIMSSLSSACDHIHHVKTQIPYSLLVGALAVVCGYLPAAAGWPSYAGLALGAGSLIGFLLLLRARDAISTRRTDRCS